MRPHPKINYSCTLSSKRHRGARWPLPRTGDPRSAGPAPALRARVCVEDGTVARSENSIQPVVLSSSSKIPLPFETVKNEGMQFCSLGTCAFVPCLLSALRAGASAAAPDVGDRMGGLELDFGLLGGQV